MINARFHAVSITLLVLIAFVPVDGTAGMPPHFSGWKLSTLPLVSPATEREFRIESEIPPAREASCPCSAARVATSISFTVRGDAQFIYFETVSERASGGFGAALLQTPKSGGKPEPLIELEGDLIFDFLVDDERVYLATNRLRITGDTFELIPGSGRVIAVSKSGGPASDLGTGLSSVVRLAADSTHVYWVSSGTQQGGNFAVDGKVERRAKSRLTAAETLASNLRAPQLIALDGETVFFTECESCRTGGAGGAAAASGIRGVSKNGGTIRRLVDIDRVISLAVSDGSLLYSTARTSAIFQVSTSSGALQATIPTAASPVWIEVRGTRLFYLLDDDCGINGSLRSVDLLTQERSTLRSGLECPTSFFVDECHVYVASDQGVERACAEDLRRRKRSIRPGG